MTQQRGLTATYEESRLRFLAAAAEAGASVSSSPHAAQGMAGEALAIDVASVGPEDADAVLLIVSGTHGVEGFTGSALQHHWLDRHEGDRPDDVRVVLLHAFNPYGFSWVRRVNEDNVDLNRNFIDWAQPPPANEDYGGIAHLLVPDEWDDDTQQSTLSALLAYAGRLLGERYTHVETYLGPAAYGVLGLLVLWWVRPSGQAEMRRWYLGRGIMNGDARTVVMTLGAVGWSSTRY